MKSQNYALLGSYLAVMIFTLSGCTINKTSTANTNEANQATKQSVPTHMDGQVISLTPIQVANIKDVNTYQMMYWSNNTKTEAFLAVPQASGTYPLLVECHGGSPIATDASHQYTFGMNASALSGVSPHYITLIPEYRGYGGSDGTVQGLWGDTLDVNNAIKAVMSKFLVKPHHIYLDGTSMGGGVVLKLASERSDIRSVIATSPWVGMDIVGEWASKHKNDGTDRSLALYDDMLSYGTSDPHSPVLKEQSIDYRKITAPVLLLQGTGDAIVPWQTVQTFYNHLKPYDVDSKLILFPGGVHGLIDKYQNQVNQDVAQWYRQYGENSTKSHS